MDFNALDAAIDELERMIPGVAQIEFIRQRHSWRPIWAQCKVIQEGFSAVRYPSNHERNIAWERFQHLRHEASERKQWEEEGFLARSAPLRDDILGSLYHMKVEPFVDFLTMHTTTAQEMKELGRALQSIRDRLREYQPCMTYEHVGECRDAIADVKRNYDEWWENYKNASAVRSEERQRQQHEYEQRNKEREERRADQLARVLSNISDNRDKRSVAYDNLERARSHLRDTESKLSEATSEKWEQIFSEWVFEAEQKIESIEGWIRTLDEWIEEGESKAASLRNRS